MGYAAEKKKVERKIRKVRLIVSFAVTAVLICVLVFSFIVPPQTWKYYVAQPALSKREAGDMRLHFIDVGQGDASLIELPDGKVMLIDGGDGSKQANKALLRHILALDIKKINYLVATHADGDHVGGLAEVLDVIEVEHVYLPLFAEEENDAYQAFLAQLTKRKITSSYAAPPNAADARGVLSVTEGEYPYTVAFISPRMALVNGKEDKPKEDNDASVVAWVDYQGQSALFTGDASAELEERLIEDADAGTLEKYGVYLHDTEILKVAHHGSATSTSSAFLQYLQVETAVISCGVNNIYSHPSGETLKRLETAGVKTLRTDVNGSVIITLKADGTRYVQALGKAA